VNNQIGERIRLLRQKSGYTQNNLGKMLYVSGQSVSKWEKGESFPSIENIDLLCKVFHISPNELLDYKEEKVITNSQYGADMIIRSSILCFVINILLYILGTVCIYAFDAILNIAPFNWVIGGILWAIAIFFTIYTTINNIFTFRRINGKYKHVVYILTLGLTSILFFPLISISIFQMISEMVHLLFVGRFNFISWILLYGLFLSISLASVSLYIVLLKINKKKYSRNS